MRTSRLLLLSSLALTTVLTALPAEARFRWGIGTGLRIPGTGIHTGVGYSAGRWGSGVDTNVWVDAGYYLNRRRERKRDRDRDREEARENVTLRVSPNNAWVYLNGVPVEAYGKDEITLPPGKHRLEFLRAGYRTEVAELDIQPGIRYKVERKLRKLERGELGDARLDRIIRPVPLEEALRPNTAPQPPAVDQTPDHRRDAEPGSRQDRDEIKF